MPVTDSLQQGLTTSLRLATSISLDYEAEKWSFLRIFLDTVSNHLDAVRSLDRIRIDVTEGAITVSDDGDGYEYTLLSLLYSTKNGDTGDTIGRFGEGIKLVATACLRHGLEFVVRSRDWTACASSEPVRIRIGPTNERVVHRLVWDVSPADPTPGSTSIIRATSGQLPHQLLDLAKRWRELFLPDDVRSRPHAWADPTPRLFVNGVYVRDLKGYHFSYNLLCPINRDRDTVDVAQVVADFWQSCENPELIDAFLSLAAVHADGYPTLPQELRLPIFPYDHKVLWADSFYRLFGKNAVLYTKDAYAYVAEAHGYAVVKLPDAVAGSLSGLGVSSDCDVVPDITKYGFRRPSPTEEEVIEQAVRIVTRIRPGISVPPIFVMDSPPSENMEGLFLRKGSLAPAIGIAAGVLGSLESALPAVIEEVGHAASGCGDITRGFEEWLVRFAADAALASVRPNRSARPVHTPERRSPGPSQVALLPE